MRLQRRALEMAVSNASLILGGVICLGVIIGLIVLLVRAAKQLAGMWRFAPSGRREVDNMADHASANLVSTLDDVATAVDEDVLKRIGLGLARTSRTTKRSIAAVIVAFIMLAEAGSITLFLGTVFMFSFLYGLIRLTRR